MVSELKQKSAHLGCAVVVFVVLAGFVLTYAKYRSGQIEKHRQSEAIATAEGFAKVLDEVRSKQSKLVVQKLTGSLSIKAVNHGTVWETWQTSRVPFSAQYTVDLSQLSSEKVRYDENTKTMFVEIPQVVIEDPNVDETKKVITGRGGVWTSREAAENIAARTSKLALAGAQTTANTPNKIKSAGDNARLEVDRLLELPLRNSKQKDLNVVVRLSTDGARDGERWDVSPSIEQILARRDP